MSLHVFANLVTPFGIAANNRGDNEGSNIMPLQKIIWQGETHSTVSAEAIRFALRRRLGTTEKTNRVWDEDIRANVWDDHEFKGWDSDKGKTFIDDDLLGYMKTEGASEESEGSANVRRSPLEATRAVSLTSWTGDVIFNAASPGATPNAAKGKGANPVPYNTEVHATRFQYGIALTPERLRDKSRAAKAIEALCNLGTVAGNHGRFLFDFSPDVVVFRITSDPAPRILYCFDTNDNGKTIVAPKLFHRLESGDIKSGNEETGYELIVGLSDTKSQFAKDLESKGVKVSGVKKACELAIARINKELGVKA